MDRSLLFHSLLGSSLLLGALLLGSCSRGSSTAPAVRPPLGFIGFDTRQEVAVGAVGAIEVALGDLDGDGSLDMVVATLSGKLQVLVGDGLGGFEESASYDLGGEHVQVVLADLDGDADLDVVLLRSTPGDVLVLLNDGNAGLSALSPLPAGGSPNSLALVDVDRDNRIDIVVAVAGDDFLRTYRGNGNGSFAAVPSKTTLPVGATPAGLIAADLTGDQRADLAFVDPERDQLVVLPGMESGGFGTPITYATGSFPIAIGYGDLDRDGDLDVVVSNLGSEDLSVFRNVGGRLDGTRIPAGGIPAVPLIGDVTGDGIADIAVPLADRAALVVLPGRAEGGIGAPIWIGTGGSPFRPVLGDVNGDGEPDIVVSSAALDRVSLLTGRGGRLGGSMLYETAADRPEAVIAEDFDGDGHAEMLVAGGFEPTLSLMEFVENEALNTHDIVPSQVIDLGRPIYNIAKGDFNGDGKVDIAVAMEGGIKLLANASKPGQIVFDPVPRAIGEVLIPGQGAFEIAVADMDGDGRDDIVASFVWSEEVVVLRSIGTPGSFRFDTAARRTKVTGAPAGLAIADFTGNGLLDVAVSRNQASVVTILANGGRATVTPRFDIPVGANPNYLRTADFDGDGRADLVVSNAASDSVSVLLFSGPDSFRRVDVPAGKTPTALLARDLNRDGHADILVASLTGADFRVLLGDGKGGFPVQLPFPGTFRATSADMADADGDGLPDLVVASVATTRLSYYRNISR